jgi:DNA-binding XRE family transcriptional regulator
MKKVFAANLKKVRRHLGWKSSLVASKNLGIKRPRYQAYEEARALPTIECFVNMCEVMGITNPLAFLADPNFDYRNQDVSKRSPTEQPVITKYRLADERDRKLVDQILGIPAQ